MSRLAVVVPGRRGRRKDSWKDADADAGDGAPAVTLESNRVLGVFLMDAMTCRSGSKKHCPARGSRAGGDNPAGVAANTE